MKISVAICTWNRARLLRQTLESLTRLNLRSIKDWEVIVVDNNSNDNTAKVLDSFSQQLPLNPQTEPEPGHSASRNRAVGAATGDLIVWTDNDVIVDENWLAEFQRAANEFPEAMFFGGVIEPVFESEKPAWLAATWEKCKPVFAARDIGNKERKFAEHEFGYGANFAVRTTIQKRFLFDITVGRSKDAMLGDDEIRVQRQIVEQGHYGVWVPMARVMHVIPNDRATPKYVAKYFVGQGITNVRNGRATYASVGAAFWKSILENVWYQLKRSGTNYDAWVSHLICSSIAKGEYLQLKQDARSRVGSG